MQPKRAALKRPVLLVLAGIVGVFIIVNIGLYAIFASKTYPGTKVMDTTIGSVSYDSLSTVVDRQSIVPGSVTLMHGTTKTTVKLSDLGISKDTERTISSARAQRSWLPILNLFSKPVLQAPVALDTAQLSDTQKKLAKTFTTAPTNAQLTMQGTTVAIKGGVDGYTLDNDAFGDSLIKALDSGKVQNLAVPVTTTKPEITASSLKATKESVERQLDTAIAYTYNGKTRQPSKADIAAWYIQNGNEFTPDKDAILRSLVDTGKTFGIAVTNTAQVTDETFDAVTKHSNLTLALTPATVRKTFTYCTNVKGVSVDQLPALRDKLKATYHSSKGWSLNGEVSFEYGTSDCNFTVWLTAANLMPTFGAICDSMWSCRVGPNVVINYDRWEHASPAWNSFGGSLDDYRHMVINHETGHWLGFSHAQCGGPRQQAPVMQQQSIDLQGCVFNPWPSTSELAVDRARLGL